MSLSDYLTDNDILFINMWYTFKYSIDSLILQLIRTTFWTRYDKGDPDNVGDNNKASQTGFDNVAMEKDREIENGGQEVATISDGKVEPEGGSSYSVNTGQLIRNIQVEADNLQMCVQIKLLSRQI